MLNLKAITKNPLITGIEPGQPLRYVLAGSPGVGKTIMASLLHVVNL